MSNMETQFLMNCDGRIQSNGYCDKCGNKSESSTVYCGRYNLASIEQITERYKASQPSEQKDISQGAEEYWNKIIYTQHLESGDEAYVIEKEDFLKAMQEFSQAQRLQARNEAIQECIEAVSKYWICKNDGLDPMFNDLEALKK